MLVLAGCSPVTEGERQYLERRKTEREQREALRTALVEGAKDEDVLQMVREALAPEGAGTMEAWVDRKTAAFRDQIMFPKWEVLRRGSSKYEVRYSFTVMDANSAMSKRGFYWNVDFDLRVVSLPKEIMPAELAAKHLVPDPAMKLKKKLREAELSLE